jgi:hypothetical protein
MPLKATEYYCGTISSAERKIRRRENKNKKATLF